MKSDDFEWDDSKAASNLRNHKITFEMARDVFSDPFIVEWIDEGQDESEERFAALGMVDNRIFISRLCNEGRRDTDYLGASCRTLRTPEILQ